MEKVITAIQPSGKWRGRPPGAKNRSSSGRWPLHGEAIIDAWPHKSTREIACSLGISHQRVSMIAKLMGLPPKRTRSAPQTHNAA